MSENEALHIPHVGRWLAVCQVCWEVIPVGVMLPDVCPQCGASGAHLYVLPDGLRDGLQRQRSVEHLHEREGSA